MEAVAMTDFCTTSSGAPVVPFPRSDEPFRCSFMLGNLWLDYCNAFHMWLSSKTNQKFLNGPEDYGMDNDGHVLECQCNNLHASRTALMANLLLGMIQNAGHYL